MLYILKVALCKFPCCPPSPALTASSPSLFFFFFSTSLPHLSSLLVNSMFELFLTSQTDTGWTTAMLVSFFFRGGLCVVWNVFQPENTKEMTRVYSVIGNRQLQDIIQQLCVCVLITLALLLKRYIIFTASQSLLLLFFFLSVSGVRANGNKIE